MYASVVHIKPRSFEKLRDMAKGLARTKGSTDINTIPGFRAFYVFREGPWYTTIAIFEEASGCKQWIDVCKETFKDCEKHLDLTSASSAMSAEGHVIFSRTAP